MCQIEEKETRGLRSAKQHAVFSPVISRKVILKLSVEYCR